MRANGAHLSRLLEMPRVHCLPLIELEFRSQTLLGCIALVQFGRFRNCTLRFSLG
jgi:hypothetical protein